ncbi:restriction endonuclease subunit S [Herbinix luporum]|uniref:Type I restriction modification DNA specificity domain-containing protein n=1 Tax=Herbinix luporum TaxID=1679721 RepID=A0A0K8J480_9FIRM|nr:restriction endonuclease subunit S [Herbinix luporum]CUH92300.1 hypothetical protein SD1D_0752 [Herbinix luporum]
MKASEKFRYYINSPIAYISYYFTEYLLNYVKKEKLEIYVDEIKTGKTPSKNNKEYYNKEEFSWFKPDEIGYEMYLSESQNKISNLAVEKKQATVFKKNTLLITCIGDIGRLGILKKEASSNQQITGILFKDKILPEYAFYYLLCRKNLFEDKSSSTTLPILNQKKLLNIEVRCPNFEIQREFVSFMNYCMKCLEDSKIPSFFNFNLDNQIFEFSKKVFECYYLHMQLQETNEINAILISKLRHSILQEAVQGKLVPQDPNDEPASVLLERIKEEKERLIKEGKIKKEKPLPPISEDEIPYELPKGWEWVRLGDIGDWGAGATPSRRNPKYYNGEILWLKTGELKDGYIDDSVEKITELALKECSLRLNKPGDILIAMYGATIGKLGILNVEATTNQACCGCTPFSQVYNRYLFYLLLSLREEFKGQGAGGAQPNISKQKIINTIAPLPPLNEQKRIVEKVDQLMALCDELEKNIEQSKKDSEMLMQSVLQEAFKEA